MATFEENLSWFPDTKRSGDSTWSACCPAHEDTNASLSISRGEGGRTLLHCHAGCTVDAVLKSLGKTLSDLYASPPGQLPKRRGRPPKSEAGLPRRLFSAPEEAREVLRHHFKREEDYCWIYCNAAGEPVGAVLRWNTGTGKDIRPISRHGDGWALTGMPEPRPLLDLPELIDRQTETAYVAEGERAARALRSLGLLATTSPHGSKSAGKADWSPLAGRNVVISRDNDPPGLQYANAVTRILQELKATVRVLLLPDLPPSGDAVEFVEQRTRSGRTPEQIREEIELLAEGTPIAGSSAEKPKIMIGTDEHRCVSEAIEAVAAHDSAIYRRGEILVRTIRNDYPVDGVIRASDSPIVRGVPAANLRDRLTRVADFVKINAEGEEVSAHPPPWLVSAISDRGEWAGIRALNGVSDTPFVRPDGTICRDPGYDAVTGVLLDGNICSLATIPKCASRNEAAAEARLLLEVVQDFRFETPEHASAWLAALLTPIGRFAFTGPSPIFLVDANVRGAGKGLLIQTAGRIAFGREIAVSSYTNDVEELRKKITAIAMAADRAILFDNIEGKFGNDVIDRALTSTLWHDRILGRTETVSLPLITTFYGTGNNILVAADTARRTIHIRLDVLHERPERRTGFRHPDLLGWVSIRRRDLLTAALTMLAGYLQSEEEIEMVPFGSFEGWSKVIRGAILWAGLPDPCATQDRLIESADHTLEAARQLLVAWCAFAPRRPFTTVDLLQQTHGNSHPMDEPAIAMRHAVEVFCSTPPGKTPTPIQLGSKLRSIRRRVVDGLMIDTLAAKSARGVQWQIFTTQPQEGAGGTPAE